MAAAGEHPHLVGFEDNCQRNFALLRQLTTSDLQLPCKVQDAQSDIAHALLSLLAFRAGWIVHISPQLAGSIPKAFEAGTSLAAFAASLRSADQAAISAVKSLLQQKPKFNPVLRTGPTELLLRTTIHDYGIRDSIAAALDRKPK